MIHIFLTSVFMPKLSTTRVKEIGRDPWYHTQGCSHSRNIQRGPVCIGAICWPGYPLAVSPTLPFSFLCVPIHLTPILLGYIAQLSTQGKMTGGCVCTQSIWVPPWGKSFWCWGTYISPFLCWSYCSNATLLFLSWPCGQRRLLCVWSSCPRLWCGCNVDRPFVADNQQQDCVRIFFCCKGMSYFIVCHDNHCVCAFLPRLVATLCHSAKILTKCSLPHLGRCRIVHQLFIAWNCFGCDGVDFGAGKIFKFDWQRCCTVFHQIAACVNGAPWHLFLNGENVYCLLWNNSLSCTAWNQSVRCRRRRRRDACTGGLPKLAWRQHWPMGFNDG